MACVPLTTRMPPSTSIEPERGQKSCQGQYSFSCPLYILAYVFRVLLHGQPEHDDTWLGSELHACRKLERNLGPSPLMRVEETITADGAFESLFTLDCAQ